MMGYKYKPLHRSNLGRAILLDCATTAIVPAHLKRAGTHVGRVTTKASGSFVINGLDCIGKNYCRKLQQADGYGYSQRS